MIWHWWYWGFVVAIIGLLLQNCYLYVLILRINVRLDDLEELLPRKERANGQARVKDEVRRTGE